MNDFPLSCDYFNNKPQLLSHALKFMEAQFFSDFYKYLTKYLHKYHWIYF